MASLYDSYQLGNSSQIKRFQGSAVPELLDLGQQLEKQYDLGQQTDDNLSEFIPNTSALPEDRARLQSLRAKYNTKIADRAKQGDYENMWKDTMKDSKRFLNEYKPIAENQQRFQAYQKDLQDKLDKGYLKSPDTVKQLIQASRYGYKGLQQDPETGEYVNKFQGIDPAKEINITEWADKALDHFAPQILGSKVENIQGDYYITRGNKTTKLGQVDIDRVLSAAKALDPEWQAYAKQKATLDTIGFEGLDSMKGTQVFGAQTAAELNMAALQSGRSFGQVAKARAQAAVEQNLNGALRQYSSKFQRNDRETEFSINGMTEEASARVKKKVEDEVPVLAASILQPTISNQYSDPADLSKARENSYEGYKAMADGLNTWKQNSMLMKKGDKWIDPSGNDKTFEVSRQQDMVDQAKRQHDDLTRREQKVKAQVQYSVSPEIEKQANDAYTNTLKAYKDADETARKGGITGQNYVSKSNEEVQAIANKARDKIIEATPSYRRYAEALKADAQGSSALVGVQTFGTKSSNDQATSIFKNLALDLDRDGLKSGLLGLTWGSGEKANQALSSDDYSKIRDDAEFAGVGIDTDGQYKYFYKVGKVDAKGKGEPIIVKMPALSGTAETLIKNKQITEARQFVHQAIATQLAFSENKQGAVSGEDVAGLLNKEKGVKVAVAPGTFVNVEKVLPSQAGSYGISNAQYIVKFPIPGGFKSVPVSSLAEATEAIIQTIKASQ